MSETANRKQILVLGYDSTGEDQFFTNETAFSKWCHDELDARMIADVTTVLLQEKPAQMTNVSHVVRKIKQEWKHVDGIVCILPPEQFLLVATRMAFTVGAVGKPIVLATAFGGTRESRKSFYTSPELPLHAMNAVQVATVDVSGVLAVGGSEVFPVTHAVAGGHNERLLSADRLVFGHVDFGVRTTHAAIPRSSAGLDIRAVDSSVAFVDASLHDAFVESLATAAQKNSGVVVTNGSAALRQVIDDACLKTFPVLMCEGERVHVREKGRWSVAEGLTANTAAAKFAWILEHRKSQPGLRRASVVEAMKIDLIGETLL